MEKNSWDCIKNCIISLLNSKVIDVDRMDYLIRDAYTSGFNTISIDYQRLLKSVTVVRTEREEFVKYELAYYKNAVSIIENVVYAHDAERKWIQTHPTVIYESYLLGCIFDTLNKTLININGEKAPKLFSVESLGIEGNDFENGIRISLLCDDDIIYLMKTVLKDNEQVKEYFCRNMRRHPVWKSEAEYNAYIPNDLGSGELGKIAIKKMKLVIEYLAKNTQLSEMNDFTLEQCRKDLETTEERLREQHASFDTIETNTKDKALIFNTMQQFRRLAEQKGMENSFVVVPSSHFNSGFSKGDFGEINIVFVNGDERKPVKFKNVINPLGASAPENEEFYYLFYRKYEAGKTISTQDIYKLLKSDE